VSLIFAIDVQESAATKASVGYFGGGPLGASRLLKSGAPNRPR
jgi:hypothetical protein